MGHCMIRNVAKCWAEPEIWREAGTDDAAQARMARRIEVERQKRAFDAALRRIGGPCPGRRPMKRGQRSIFRRATSRCSSMERPVLSACGSRSRARGRSVGGWDSTSSRGDLTVEVNPCPMAR